MNVNNLKKILSIPTYSGYEFLLKEYVISFCKDNDYLIELDSKGNVYITKGVLDDGEYYPCVSAHLDSVYENQIKLIINGGSLNIKETLINNDIKLSNDLGIGGDDKCGVFICLELLLKLDKLKVILFVEEECGCYGSKNSNKNMFLDVGYVIEFDAPTNDWCSLSCSGVDLFNYCSFELIKPILNKYNIYNFSVDPYTDVAVLRRLYNISCFNFFSGYYNQHRGSNEYVMVNDVKKALNMGYEIIQVIGNNLLFFEKDVIKNKIINK